MMMSMTETDGEEEVNTDPADGYCYCFDLAEQSNNSTSVYSFLLDSGSSEHVINNKALAVHFDPIQPIRLKTALNSSPLIATHKGTLELETLGGTPFREVLFAEQLNLNLLSTKTSTSNLNAVDLLYCKQRIQISKKKGMRFFHTHMSVDNNTKERSQQQQQGYNNDDAAAMAVVPFVDDYDDDGAATH